MTGSNRRRVISRLRSDLPLALVDIMLVAGSFLVLLAVRFDGNIPSQYQSRLFAFLPVIILVHLGSNLAWGLYGQIWKHASVAEARRIVFAGATAGALIFLVNPTRAFPVPRSVALIGAFVATMVMGAARFQGRLRRRSSSATPDTASATRVAIVGAGDAGATIVREMRRQTETDRVPVAIVDDDPRKQGRSMLGVPVVGDIANLPEVVQYFKADEVLVAIPSAGQQLINEIMDGAELAGVPLKVLPPVGDLLNDRPSVRDARDINIEDLLGRAQVATDIEEIRAVVGGATVLITGAGGSIGSEIAKQVADLGPGRLVLLDHDETHLHDVNGQLRSPAELDLIRFGHFNGAIKRNGTALGNVISTEITYANNLDRIETIRSDGRIDGADPSIAALTGRIEVRFAEEGPAATRVTLTHRHFGRHGEGGDQMRDGMASEQGWPGLLERFRRVAEGE